MARDPVCGMTVDEERAAARIEYRDETYCFCSLGCKVAFDMDPTKYVPEGRSVQEASYR